MFCNNKFGLNLETVFSYTGGQRNSLDNIPCTRRDQEPSCYLIKIKHSELYFCETSENICFKEKWQIQCYMTFRSTLTMPSKTKWFNSKFNRAHNNASVQGGTIQDPSLLWPEKLGFHYGNHFHLPN